MSLASFAKTVIPLELTTSTLTYAAALRPMKTLLAVLCALRLALALLLMVKQACSRSATICSLSANLWIEATSEPVASIGPQIERSSNSAMSALST